MSVNEGVVRLFEVAPMEPEQEGAGRNQNDDEEEDAKRLLAIERHAPRRLSGEDVRTGLALDAGSARSATSTPPFFRERSIDNSCVWGIANSNSPTRTEFGPLTALSDISASRRLILAEN